MEKKKEQQEPQYISRDILVRMEVLSMLTASVVLMALALFMPAPLGEMADPTTTPPHVSAPWIFAWVQELLRHLPPVAAGVLIPLSVFLLLMALPFFQAGEAEEGVASLKRRLFPLALLSLVLLFIAVMTFLNLFR